MNELNSAHRTLFLVGILFFDSAQEKYAHKLLPLFFHNTQKNVFLPKVIIIIIIPTQHIHWSANAEDNNGNGWRKSITCRRRYYYYLISQSSHSISFNLILSTRSIYKISVVLFPRRWYHHHHLFLNVPPPVRYIWIISLRKKWVRRIKWRVATKKNKIWFKRKIEQKTCW